MMIEKVIEQIGLTTPANTSDNLNKTIVLSFYQFVQIEISADLHSATSFQKIFATLSIFLFYFITKQMPAQYIDAVLEKIFATFNIFPF